MSANYLARRIEEQRKRQARAAANVAEPNWYICRVTPTCPPSMAVYMHGGQIYYSSSDSFSAYRRRAYVAPSTLVDLTDADQVGADITFTQPDYYLAYVLILAVPAEVTSPADTDWTFVLIGSGTELATAAEAEEDMEQQALWQQRPWASAGITRGLPLCGLVLRNDGTVGGGAKILAIDRINRGRSYTWPADVRPRWSESW